MSGPIDLHAHTNVSDGTESPEQLVADALDAGLAVVAITDHDSTAGWSRAFAAAEGTGLTVLPGMELSTRLDGASVHLLGYLVDPDDPALLELTEGLRASRVDRAKRMVERIAADYPVDWEEVLAVAGEGATVGRPHIADALVARGHVPDRSTAFREILHFRGRYYVSHEAPSPLEGVRRIVDAGGVPVLAHPGGRAARGVLDGRRIRELVDAGLAGIEIDHRDNLVRTLPRLRMAAKRHGLLVTGSSDYHGAGKPNRLGEHTTDPEVYAAIVERGTGSRPFRG